MATDNKQLLYNALSEEYDLGSYDDFCKDINDDAKRRKLYDATVSEYDYGSYDDFSKQLGYAASAKPARASQYFKLRRGGKDFTVSENEVKEAGGLQAWADQNPGAPIRVYMEGTQKDGKEFKGHVALSDAHKRRKDNGYKYTLSAKPITTQPSAPIKPVRYVNAWQPTAKDKANFAELTAKADAMFDEVDQQNKDMQEYIKTTSKDMSYGKTAKSNKLELDPTTGKAQQTYLTPDGRTTNKAIADVESSSWQQQRAEADMSINAQLQRAQQRLNDVKSQIVARYNEVIDKIDEDFKKNPITTSILMSGGDASSNAGTNMYNQILNEDPTYNALKSQKSTLEDEIQTLNNAKDKAVHGERFLHDFFRNTGQQIARLDAWDFGYSALKKASTTAQIAQKSNTNPDLMTRAEKDALYETYLSQNVQSQYGDLGAGSSWGDIAGSSLSFMKDFLITGGFKSITTGLTPKIAQKAAVKAAAKIGGDRASKAVAMKIARDGLLTYLRSGGTMTKALAAQGLSGLTSSLTLRALGVQAEHLLIHAPLMTATVQGLGTAASVINSKYGDVIVDNKTGQMHFADDKSWGSALYQAGVDAVLENYSEMWGEHIPSVSDVTRALGARNLTAAILKSTREGAGTILSNTNKFLARAGVNGYFGEVGEEYYGQLWKTMLNLDSAYGTNPDGSRGKNNFLDGKFHGDIWGGMAMSIGVSGGGTMLLNFGAKKGAQGLEKGKYVYFKHQLSRADARASALFPQADWETMRSIIDNRQNDEMGALAGVIIKDKTINEQQRSAIMDYMEKTLNFRGYNLREMLLQKIGDKKDKDAEAASQAFFNGYNSTTRGEMMNAQSMYEQKLSQVKEVLPSDVVEQLDQDPIATLKSLRDSGVYDPGVVDAARDYVNAKMVHDGVFQMVRDEIDTKVAQSDANVDAITNKDTGAIHLATMNDGRKVYVISGTVKANQDGNINSDESSELLIVKDAETGEVEFTNINRILSVEEAQDPEEIKKSEAERISNEVSQSAVNDMNGTLSFTEGETITLTDGKGGYVDVTVIGDGLNENGEVTVEYPDGGLYTYKPEDLQKESDLVQKQKVEEFEQKRKAEQLVDNQGNPINDDGSLKLEAVESVDEISDEDFQEPSRSIELPTLPQAVNDALGANGRVPIIKKNIFGKNRKNHKDLTPEDSRKILREALYNPSLYGQNRKASRPYNWILVHLADKSSAVVVEVNNPDKSHMEIVNWHYIGGEELERKKRQAIKEGGLILTLSEDNAAANTHNNSSSVGKGNNLQSDTQGNGNQMLAIPTDEKGEPMYDQVDPDVAWDGLVAQAHGSEAIAAQIAAQEVVKAEKRKQEAQEVLDQAERELTDVKNSQESNETEVDPELSITERIAAMEAAAAQKENELSTAESNAEAARAEVEAASAALEHWKKIASTKQRRKEAEIRAQAEAAAEAERKRKEEEQRLREELGNIPDISEDKPVDARARGKRRVGTDIVERQQPITGVEGGKTDVKFSKKVKEEAQYVVVEAEEVQPSHRGGVANPKHFIPEAQPKDRTDNASRISATDMAANMNPEEITGGVTAYTGAPVVNARGEVVQGNGRSDALRIMWEDYGSSSGAAYKQYLIDHAEEFGLDAEAVANMQHPVLVRRANVSDERAIELGQYTATDTESGGIERIKSRNVCQKLRSAGKMRAFIQLLMQGDDEMSFSQLIDANGAKVIKWLNELEIISDTQSQSAFDSRGELTAEAKNDLRNIVFDTIFAEGNENLPKYFSNMPAKAQRAILATAFRDFESDPSNSMLDEIQQSIIAYEMVRTNDRFSNAKNIEEALRALEDWKRQYEFDLITGEPVLPSNKFSNFALHLVAMYKGDSQSHMQAVFNELYDLIQGKKEANLFDPNPDRTPRTLAAAIKEVLNIDYNGNKGRDVVGGTTKTDETGGSGSESDGGGGKQNPQGEGTTDNSGGTEGDGEITLPPATLDTADSTKPSLMDVVHTLYTKGKEVANKLFQMKYFDVAKTPEFMKALGLTGDKFTIRYGVIARHMGKDAQHNLPEEVWAQLPEALQHPFAITRINNKDNSYRIYTTLKTPKGEFIVVGVDVKSSGRDMEVNSISTIFGRRNDAGLTAVEEVIYKDKEITPEQQSLLDKPNSHQYPADQELSEGKGSKKSDDSQEDNKDLTEDEIRNSGLPSEITAPALQYIKGDRSPAVIVAYNIAKDYVRNQSRESTGNSEHADETQLGGGSDEAGTLRGGSGGGSSLQVDNGDHADNVPGNGLRGTNSPNDVASSDGEGGNIGVSSGTPVAVRNSPGSNGRGGSSVRGSSGSLGGSKRGGRGSGKGVSGANGQGISETGSGSATSLKDDLSAELDNLKDILKDALLPPQDRLYDVTALMANLGVNAARAFVSTAKIGGILVRMGYRRFKRWCEEMHGKLDGVLRQSTHLTPEQIDEFIRMMWDTPFEINGEVHKISEWASILDEADLRKQMAMSIEEKRKQQEAAEPVATILGDIENIRESLPFLLPKQQEDVELAEIQFFNESHKDAEHGNGKGYLFTNGTGTGKTYTGLGIAKRFLKRGKGRILIVTASESKIKDFIRDAKNLGINASMLQDTKSKGEGVVVTQYANMYQNYSLLEDSFDLIIFDESHKLMENQFGTVTARTRMQHMLCNRDAQQVVRRKLFNTPLFVRGRQIQDEIAYLQSMSKKASRPSTSLSTADIKTIRSLGGKDGIVAKLEALSNEAEQNHIQQQDILKSTLENKEELAKAQEEVDNTKVVFLSATPFNTALSMDYAESYIFSYPREENAPVYETEEERAQRQGAFVMDKFGASHKRANNCMVARKTEAAITDPQLASEQEIEFSDHLQNDLNTSSGRALDSEYDYSREFPLLSDPASARINQAINELTKGKYQALAKAFSNLLSDYPTMTALFEIIKTQQSIARIKEHLAHGRKVAIYHRRMSSIKPITPPFATGLKAAMEDSNLKQMAAMFAAEYQDLLSWEKNLNLKFPNEQIIEAFATEEEKAQYKKDYAQWIKKYQKAIADGKRPPKEPRLKSAMVVQFNGTVSDSVKQAARDVFNDDNSPCKIIICQVQSAKEGIDLHDKTGKHQRVLMSLSLPQSPIEFIQTEGRIYRIGNKSDAIFEYPIIGIDLEVAAFALKINGRSETEENLALGSKSRGLRDSIMRAVLGARDIPVTDNMGKGGKALDDRAMQQRGGYEEAVNDYSEWAAEEKPESFDEMEVPNPIGYKMIEWAKSENGETLLIPNAKRGSIAKYAPGKSRLIALEAAMDKYTRLLAMIGGGGRKILQEFFKDYSISNKADCVVMNCEHSKTNDILVPTTHDQINISKAFRHLEEGGRIVAVVSADANLQLPDEAVVSAEIKLPAFVFNGNQSKVVVIDKVSNEDLRKGMPDKVRVDLSNRTDQKTLFADLKAVDVPARTIDKKFRVRKRVKKVAANLKESPILRRRKVGGKLVPDIYDSYNEITFYTKGDVCCIPRVDKYGTIKKQNGFTIRYDYIVNDEYYEYRTRLAQTYLVLRDMQGMEYEEAQNKYGLSYRITEKEYPGLAEIYGIVADMIEAALGKTSMQIKNLAEGRVENEVRGEMDADKFEEAFRSLNADNVELSTLADRVFAVIRQVPGIRFRVVNDISKFRSDNVVAHYAPGQNAIELNGNMFNSTRISDEQKASTIVHEMIHAVTCYIMSRYENGMTGNLTEEQIQACKDIYDVYDIIKDDPEFRVSLRQGTKISDNVEYGMTNAYEMMAELANPVFRMKLKAKKLWRYLLNGIKQLLGIDIKQVKAEDSTDALTVLDRALETLMNSFDARMYSAYTGGGYMNSTVTRFENAIQSSYELKQINDTFNQELDAFANGEQYDNLHLGKPGRVLRACGLNTTEMFMTPKTLGSHMKKHNLSIEDVKDLPEALQDPLMVYTWGSKAKSLIVITDMQRGDQRITAAVKLERNGKAVEVNEIASVHGKDIERVLAEMSTEKSDFGKDNLKYVDKEKAADWLGLVPPKGTASLTDQQLRAAKIIKDFENPKIEDEKNAETEDETLQREGDGYGEYSDSEMSFLNDPGSRVLGKNRFTKAQQKRFVERERARMRARVEELVKKLHLTNVEVIEDASGLTGRRAKAKGFFNRRTGKITIILRNNLNASDIEVTLLHEAVAHYGLRKLFGEHFNDFLDNVYKSADLEIREKIANLAARNGWDFRTATEEYLASLAEDTEYGEIRTGFDGWWYRVKSLFMDMLSKIGFKGFEHAGVVLTDNELRYLLWRSYVNLAEPGHFNSILGEAENVSMQERLGVSYDAKRADNIEAADEDEYLLRDGDFSPRIKTEAREAYNRMVANAMNQFTEAVQDSMMGLKSLYQAILGKGTRMEDVPESENAYQFENAMSSINAAQEHWYNVAFMKPLLKCVSRLTGKSKEAQEALTKYMMAKHGLERNEYMRAEATKNGEKADRDFAGLTGLTGEKDWAKAEELAKQIVDEYESSHDAYDIDDLWDAVNKATKETLERLYYAGIISEETLNNVSSMYKYYIPLRGFDETTSDEVYGYMLDDNSAMRGSIVKKAEGRKSKADDPIATIAMMAEAGIRQGNRNLMKQRFLNFVLNHPSDAVSVHDLWLQKNDATGLWEPVFVDIDPNDTPEEVESKVKAFEENMETLKEAAPDKYKRGREAADVPYRVINGNLEEHQVLVKRNGRTYVLIINGNPRAAQAINGLTNPDVEASGAVGNIFKGAQWINRQLSAFYTTRNPDFVVSNFFRDMIYSNCMSWVKESPRYALAFHKNFGKFNPIILRRLIGKWERGTLSDTSKTERLFKQFMLNGGETGYTSVRDIEAHKKAVAEELNELNGGNIGKKVWHILALQLDMLNRAAENCARFAAFVTSREYGRSVGRSIYDAKEVSVNFNKKGSGGKMVNATGQTGLGKLGSYISGIGRLCYVFWNAGVQGLSNVMRHGAKRNPAKFVGLMGALFGLGYLIPVIAQMIGGGDGDDDDENAYYNLPEYIRRSNICFRAGKQWITIPLPIEYRAIYGMGELACGTITGKERYSDSELAFQMMSQISQVMPLDMLEGGGGVNPLIPSLAKPATEAYVMNKSWTGMPISRNNDYNRADPEWTKAYSNTSTHLVDFARWLNSTTGGDDYKKGAIDINPAKLEYLISGTFGGMYSFPSKVYKTGESIFGDREFEWRNTPIANRLVKSGDERTAYRKLKSEYYKYKKECEETGRLVRKYTNAAGKGALDYAEKLDFLENSDKYQRWEIFEAFDPDIKAYQKAAREAQDEEERAQMDSTMYDYMHKMLKLIHEVGKEGKNNESVNAIRN